MKTHIQLSNGSQMPIIGYGMWQSQPDELEGPINKALEVGYRHFDTAFGYENEAILGKVIKQWIDAGKLKREDLFIVTKLPMHGNHPDRLEKFLIRELKDLQMDYVDLFLIHNPAPVKNDPNNYFQEAFNPDGSIIPDDTTTIEQVWKAMEAQVSNGKAKAIGISNYSPEQVERIAKIAKIKPANHQFEVNANHPQNKLRAICAKHGITVCAYAPLGSPGRSEYYKTQRAEGVAESVRIPKLLEDPVVLGIGKKHRKTPAQVLLRFLTQQDIIVIPKSVTPARIKENFEIFDFVLDSEDMSRLHGLKIQDSGTFGFDWDACFPGLKNHPEFQMT